MFQQCNAIEYLDLSYFNTSNITDMQNIFNLCHKLKEIKGTNKFITNKVINIRGMLQQYNVIEYLDLSNFNTLNVTDMQNIFFNCNKLKYLNVLNFSLKIDCITKNIFNYIDRNNCNLINNNNLIKLYY